MGPVVLVNRYQRNRLRTLSVTFQPAATGWSPSHKGCSTDTPSGGPMRFQRRPSDIAGRGYGGVCLGDQSWWLVVCREGGSSDVCVRYVLGVGAAKLLLQRSGSQHHLGPVPGAISQLFGGVLGRSRDRPLGVQGVHSRGRALASSSARCVPRRPASCSSWVRQENPSASTTVSRPESRTAGRSCCSATATETS